MTSILLRCRARIESLTCGGLRMTSGILAALLVAPALSQTTTRTFQMSDHLPLAVGNSWTYLMSYHDARRDPNATTHPVFESFDPPTPEVTFTILRTEVLDGETYYLFSDVPAGWPPAPAHSVAGKKLRWDGDNLTEHDGTSSFSILRFRDTPSGEGEYSFQENDVSASDAKGDTSVRVGAVRNANMMSKVSFAFSGGRPSSVSLRTVHFVTGYGMTYSSDVLVPEGEFYPVLETSLSPVRATILMADSATNSSRSEDRYSHRTIKFLDVFAAQSGDRQFPEGTTSSISNASWGELKESRY